VAPYVPRLIDALLRETLDEFAAVMIVGPRASGKTTSARQVSRSTLQLDRPNEAGPLRADPDEVLGAFDTPLLIDEWQLVPEVLPAVKRAVDADSSPGRFVLTGSLRADLLQPTWAATGRVIVLTQWGLCERELASRTGERSFIDLLFDTGIESLRSPAETCTLRDYLARALRGMPPEVALRSSTRARSIWWESYVHQLIGRDATLADTSRDPALMRRYLQSIAASTAGVVDHKRIYDAAGVSRMTAVAYDSLFEALFATERVPAWHTNRLNRLTRTDKRYMVDPAMLGPLLGVDERSLLRDGDLLGRLIDTYVLAQLRPELTVASSGAKLYHLRHDAGTHEIDLIAESRDGRIAGIECKANSAPDRDDAAHLIWLRDQLGDRFTTGVVLHTGPRIFRIDERIYAVPIASIWDRGAPVIEGGGASR
jgi:uncharacterized protein